MKVLSVNVSLPKEVSHEGRTVRTSIFKEPVSGQVMVRRLNIDGDDQSDRRVHGVGSSRVRGCASSRRLASSISIHTMIPLLSC